MTFKSTDGKGEMKVITFDGMIDGCIALVFTHKDHSERHVLKKKINLEDFLEGGYWGSGMYGINVVHEFNEDLSKGSLHIDFIGRKDAVLDCKFELCDANYAKFMKEVNG